MFKDFQTLMLKRKRTVDDLVDIFRGKIEEPREFFERLCHAGITAQALGTSVEYRKPSG